MVPGASCADSGVELARHEKRHISAMSPTRRVVLDIKELLFIVVLNVA